MQEIVMMNHPILSIGIHQNLAINAKDQDGSFLKVDVRNALPCVRHLLSIEIWPDDMA